MDRERLGNAVARSLDVAGAFRIRGEEVLATAADLNTLAGAASRATGPTPDATVAPTAPAAPTTADAPAVPASPPAPPGPKVAGGKATIVGAGAVPSGLASIASAVASLGQDASADAASASATWSGDKLTLKVWKADGTAATAPAVVHWVAVGS